MIRSLFLSLGLALGATLVASAARPGEEAKPFAIGDKIDPKIALKDVDGKTWTLGDFQKTAEHEGKVVVLDFWSIACPVSVGYETRIKKLAADCQKDGVVFLAIDANHTEVDADAAEPYARIKAYTKKAEVTFPILVDRGNVVADRFGGKTTPHIFVIDKEGILQYMGAVDDDSGMAKEKAGEMVKTYAADAVKAALAGKKPETASTPPVGCSIKRAPKAAQ
jgi:thiol-disulfide isomerase/thioredoxin